MACTNCGFESPAGVRFCVECGTPLAPRCPACQSEARPGQKFCGECGTSLTPAASAAPAPTAVRKTVTVLFADLGGSTGFGERTDAEVSREVLAEYHALLQAVIDEHAGTVAKFMGDGMMATFGIPEVAEDDARRAVAAGAAMQQRFHEFAAEIDRRYGETLTLRVGINTGEVVIGAGDADLIGDALNVAARLEKACRPGHVLVGEETWRLTRGDVGYEELGDVTVAGRAQPVAIYELALEADVTPEIATPFVGRDAEMQRLVGVFDDARRTSNARLVTVLGSPGVGKTRLSRELCSYLADHADAQRVELRCDRAGEATFAPVAQLIRDAAGLNEDTDADAGRAAIGTLLPETEADHARVVDVLAALVGAAPARSVEETFWGVRRLIEATATRRPLVVVIDDIQWAEPLLLDLIEHLAEWVADAAVLLVGLARPELREVRPSLAEPGRPVAAVVVLDGLDASATEALAAGLLGTDRLPAGLVERLPASTDGNPLFVRELVRMLVDDRVIRQGDDGEWELTIDAEAVDVPPTIQSLLGARVERLPAAERELLEQASVVGAEFSLGALRELAGASAPIVPMLETMRRKELVEPTGTYWGDEPVYRFHHVLIRDAAYRRLLKTTRADLHERVAAWTDRTATDLIGEHETAIAFHYEQAYRYRGELGALDDDRAELGRRAAELLTTAAQRALGRDDLAAAGASSARALALLPESDAAARADLLMMGCECLLATGDGAAARPLVEELVRTAADEPRLAAWGECYAAQLVGLTDPDGLVTADAQAQAAADALTALDDGSGQAKAHQVRAGLLARLGRVGDAELELDLALAAARAADDRRRVTAVLGAAPDAALFGPSPVARAGGRCLDVVRLLRITTASPSVEAASNRCQAVLEALRGRFDVSRSMLAAARASLVELGLRHALAQTELYAGMVELIAGDPHGAIVPLRAAYEGLGTLGVGADAGQAAALLATALLAEGEVDEAELMAAESEALAGQNLKTAIGWRVARAEVLAARGDLAGAVAVAEEAVGIAAGTDLVIDHADACVALASLRARAGDAAGARAARADAKRLYEQKGATVPAERLDEDSVAVVPDRPVATAPEPVAKAGHLDDANTASRVYAHVMGVIASGDDRELDHLIAREFLLDDRRHVVNYGVADLADAAAQVSWLREEGFVISAPYAVAVRGERLALCWNDTRTQAGDDISSLTVVGTDEHDRLVVLVQFDADDFVAAQAELDTRYLAGEGAEYVDTIRPMVEHLAAFHARDWDALAESVRGYEIVDHRGLWPAGGPEAYVERMQSLVAAGPDATIVARVLVVRGDALLMSADVRAAAAHGDRHEYTFHTVGGPGRFEHFDEADFSAALARLEELGATTAPGPHVVTVGNTASRVWAQALVASNSGDDGALGALVAPGYHLDARQRLTGAGAFDRGDARAILSVARDQGFEYSAPSVVAIRGARLALCAGAGYTPAGDEDLGLQLIEVDERGRMVATVVFDDVDLAAAIEELDVRYIEGEGAEHVEIIATNAAFFRAMDSHDHDAARALAAPGFVYVTDRHLGSATLDLDGYFEWRAQYADVSNGIVIADLEARGRVIRVTSVNRALGPDGGEVLWSGHLVGLVDANGRATRVEAFAAEDRDAAFARFEELSRGGAAPPLENAATRATARFAELVSAGRIDETRELFSEDHTWVDRRRTVSGPATNGYDEMIAAGVRAFAEVGFVSLAFETVAVRGDRLQLYRSVSRTADGREIAVLAITEVDATGRSPYTAWYDPDDLASAVAELEERYVVGEGAEHAELVTTNAAWNQALSTHDYDALRNLAAGDVTFVDYQVIGRPALDLEEFIEWYQTYADFRFSYVTTNLRVRGQVTLTTNVTDGVAPDGGAVVYAYHSVAVMDVDCRARRVETFDENQWDGALARFDELSAAAERSGSPVVENHASRLHARVIDAVASHEGEYLARLLAPEFRYNDRRSVVNMGDNDLAAATEHLVQLREAHYVWRAPTAVAVRGERLALVQSEFRTAAGDDSSSLVIAEIDEQGRLLSITQLDDDALDVAVAELDARYAAGEGAACADLVRTNAGWMRAMNSFDFDAMRELAAPGLTFVDGRPFGLPSFDIDTFIEFQRGYADMRNSFLTTILFVRHRYTLSSVVNRAVDADGGEVVWAYHLVGTAAPDGRTLRAETFAEDDWDAARARFDDLSAIDQRTPEVESLATRVTQRMAGLANAGRFDEMLDAYRPDFERIDHRGIVSSPPLERGAAEYLEGFRAYLEVFDRLTVEPVAVRGERVALNRSVVSSDDGLESVFLHVVELDGAGLVARMAYFEEQDLALAIEELDARYVAGEGAEYANEVAAVSAWARAIDVDDFDAMRALATSDFTFVPRRRFSWSTLDIDGFIEQRRRYASDQTHSFLVANLLVRNRVVLMTGIMQVTSPDGGAFEWAFPTVSVVSADGRTERTETFDEDKWDAARARFDELAASTVDDARTPEVVNASTRVMDRLWNAAVEQRFDDVAEMLAPDVERIDHRAGLAIAPLTGVAAYLDLLRASFGRGEVARVVVTPLAVRGDRLSLAQVVVHVEDFEIALVMVAELDGAGRVAFVSIYEVEDLAAAIEELDAHYVASGDATEAEIDLFGNIAALNRRDWKALAASLSPDLVAIDHSPLGFPPAGRDDFVRDQMQGLVAMVPDAVVIPVKAIASGDAVVVVFHTVGTTGEGSSYEWTPVAVAHRGADGLTSRSEFFPVEDWDAALTRFDELGALPAAPDRPTIDNAATRLFAELVVRTNAGDAEGLRFLMAPGFEASDRRSVTAGPNTSGEAFVGAALDAVDVFDSIVSDETLATRGDRLSMGRSRFVSANGFDVAMLGLGEIDEEGRARAIVMFDEEDLAGAMQEMEDRYCAGEGAADAYTIRRAGDVVRSMAWLDGAATLGICDPGVEFSDHRTLGFGTIGFEEVRQILAARDGQIAEDSSYSRTLQVRGDATFGWIASRGVSPAGSEVDYQFLSVSRFSAGRMRSVDWYDVEDHATAQARFEELAAADPRTPALDNACVRVIERHAWLLRHDLPQGLDRALDLLAPDVVQIDRRRGASNPDLVGREKRLEVLAGFVDVFGTDDIAGECLAVRGERLQLHRWRVASKTGSGFEVAGLDVSEIDGVGQICRIVSFDEDDFAGALEELERRHEELSGDGYATVERTYARISVALTRGDIEAWRALRASDLRTRDHSPVGAGSGGAEALDAYMSEWLFQTPDLVNFRRRSFAAGDRGLSVLMLRGTTPEGNRYEREFASVARVDAAGRLAEEHYFPIEQWDEARALFDELEAAETVAAATDRRAADETS